MNYQRLHDAIIEDSRISSPIGYKHNNKLGIYKEEHHIIPRCLFVDKKDPAINIPTNRIYLTARRHFLIHRILTKIYPENSKIWYAFGNMTTGPKYRCEDIGWIKSRSKKYEHIKSHLIVSDETRLKLSQRIFSPERNAKISKSKTGRKLTPEHRAKISAGIRLSVKSR